MRDERNYRRSGGVGRRLSWRKLEGMPALFWRAINARERHPARSEAEDRDNDARPQEKDQVCADGGRGLAEHLDGGVHIYVAVLSVSVFMPTRVDGE